MRRTICIAVLALVWCGCSKDDESKKPTKKVAKPTPGKTTPPKKPTSKAKPKAAKPKPKPPARPKVLASTPGTALRAWASKRGVGKKRINNKAVPKPVRKELRVLAKAIGGDKARPSWVHVLTPNTKDSVPALGFCFGYVEKASVGPIRTFWFSSITFEKDAYVIRRAVKTERTIIESSRNTWEFAAMRDVDGDKHNDIVMTYATSSAQAKWSQSKRGTVVLGSRGDAIEFVTSSSSTDKEAGTSSSMVATLSFTEVAGMPAVVLAKKGKAMDDVWVLRPDSFGQLKAIAMMSIVIASAASAKGLELAAVEHKKKYPKNDQLLIVRAGPKLFRLVVGLEFSVQRLKKRYREIFGGAPRPPIRYFVTLNKPYKRPE